MESPGVGATEPPSPAHPPPRASFPPPQHTRPLPYNSDSPLANLVLGRHVVPRSIPSLVALVPPIALRLTASRRLHHPLHALLSLLLAAVRNRCEHHIRVTGSSLRGGGCWSGHNRRHGRRGVKIGAAELANSGACQQEPENGRLSRMVHLLSLSSGGGWSLELVNAASQGAHHVEAGFGSTLNSPRSP